MWSETPELLLAVTVECYAGYRGEETPRRFALAGTTIEVAEVVDRWLAPDHRYFTVLDGDASPQGAGTLPPPDQAKPTARAIPSHDYR